MPKKESADDKGVSCYPAVVNQRSSVAMLEAHRQHPVSRELHKRLYEGHKSCKPDYFKLKTIAFNGSLYTYYLIVE